MNDIRFDLLTLTIARRGLLAGAVACSALGAGPRTVSAVTLPCARRGEGQRCRNSGQCCSGRCRKTHGKRKGKCRCSPLGTPCGESPDCCNHRFGDLASPQCEVQDGSAVYVCCKANGQSCGATSHCCFGMVCVAGLCEFPP